MTRKAQDVAAEATMALAGVITHTASILQAVLDSVEAEIERERAATRATADMLKALVMP